MNVRLNHLTQKVSLISRNFNDVLNLNLWFEL